jgi:hypothetical protein
MLGAWIEKLKMKCNKIYLKLKNLRLLKNTLRHWDSKSKAVKKEFMKNLYRQSKIQDKKNITATMMTMTQNIGYLLLLNNQKQES